MRFISDHFMGIILSIIAVLLITKYYFNMNIPIIRTSIGLLVIGSGVLIMLGGFPGPGKNMIIFDSTVLQGNGADTEYTMMFSSGTLDLNETEVANQNLSASILFSNGRILLDPEIPAIIRVETVFARSVMPDSNPVFFGSSEYRTPSFKEGESFVNVKADVIFGNLSIVMADSDKASSL